MGVTERFFGLVDRIRGVNGLAKVVNLEVKVGPQVEEANKEIDPHYRDLAGAYIRAAVSQGLQLTSDPLFEKCDLEAVRRLLSKKDLLEEDKILALADLASKSLDGRGERQLRKFEYQLEAAKASDVNGIPEKTKRRRNGEKNALDVAEVIQDEVGEQKAVRRSLVIEKPGKSLKLEDGDEAELLKEIRKSGSEIPDKEVLEIIRKLQTESALELMVGNMKRVKHGPFEGYREFRRGKTGRILFQIDKENVLHIRMGSHQRIYVSRGGVTKDPARSL